MTTPRVPEKIPKKKHPWRQQAATAAQLKEDAAKQQKVIPTHAKLVR